MQLSYMTELYIIELQGSVPARASGSVGGPGLGLEAWASEQRRIKPRLKPHQWPALSLVPGVPSMEVALWGLVPAQTGGRP